MTRLFFYRSNTSKRKGPAEMYIIYLKTYLYTPAADW